MKAVVFLGPSLPRERLPIAHALDVRPPVAQGDVLRALSDGATHIGIVDGLFDQVPSVWHKEIVFAIEQGVVVYGAASMGALRAAELHTLGMIGIGRVFEMYRDGLLEDDDEVAILHEDASTGYRSVSEAMVNLRDRLDAAVSLELLDRAEADALVLALKALPYPQRSVRRLMALAGSGRLEAFLRAPGTPPLKERDALALLERMTTGNDRPAPVRVRAERTVFLERLRVEVQRERWSTPHPGGTTTSSTQEIERRRSLLALLVQEHAALAGVVPSEGEQEAAVNDFQLAHSLLTAPAMEAWIAARGITVERFFELAREHATLQKLDLLYRAEIDRRSADWLDWSPEKS